MIAIKTIGIRFDRKKKTIEDKIVKQNLKNDPKKINGNKKTRTKF
jgi:hypothetical protein